MAKFEIIGGTPLKGRIKIAGNKNSVLPIMAGAILTNDDLILSNVPRISDVAVFGEIMQKIGCKISVIDDHKLKINCKNLSDWQLDPQLVSQLRASIVLMGPLLSRLGKIKMRHPGGDIIGRRAVATHFEALTSLGAKVSNDDNDNYTVSASKLSGQTIFLSEASVTATETIILAAVTAEGATVIKNAASEPHVADLCNALSKMGAKIEGVGSNLLKITGVKKLSGTNHTVTADHIEVGTFAIAAATTGGSLEIIDVDFEDLHMSLNVLSKMGLSFEKSGSNLKVVKSKLVSTPKVVSGIWPGFPTDLMSCVIVLATQAQGVTLLHDWMYESRMFFVDKLISMGAHVTICDPHRVLVYGPTKLRGQELDTPDIRAGIALVLAALGARGKSVIEKIELIERGYEDLEQRLSNLGAQIKRIG